MLEPGEIEASICEAAVHKTRRGVVRRTLEHRHECALRIREDILNGEWHPRHHEVQYVQEGSHRKRRNIVKPSWRNEQIVHHMLARQLAGIYGPRIYHYAAGTVKAPGARKGKGPLFCMRTMRRWVRKENGRKFYVAELDIARFFDSVDLDILKGMLNRRIRDRRFMRLLSEVIDAAGPGLPKGYYLSPWLAQIYLTDFDSYVTQELKPKHYLRFVDNLFLLHPNKRELHRMVQGIETYLWERLHLRLNGSRQVYRFEHPVQGKYRGRAIACTGYVVHCDRVTLRKSLLERARAKALRMHRKHRCTVRDAGAMISYHGWFRQTDTRRYYQRWIRPNVSMRYCRKRIARAARTGGNANGDRMAQGT